MKKLVRILKISATAGILAALLGGCATPDQRRTAGEYLDDQTINARVKTALVGDDDIRSRSVSTTTYDGVVQLSGFVDNADEQQRAAQLARDVDGVREVINNIEIKPDQVQYGNPGDRNRNQETEPEAPEFDEPGVNDTLPRVTPRNRSIPPVQEPRYR